MDPDFFAKLTAETRDYMQMFRRAALLLAVGVTATAMAPAQQVPGGLPQKADLAVTGTVADPDVEALLDTDLVADDALPVETADLTQDDAMPEDLPGMVAYLASSETESEELECLAGAVYFETRGEPLEGQLAVAQVIANRAASRRFPDSYCGVIHQRGQFSFVRGGQFPPIKRSSRSWKQAVAIARIADAQLHQSEVPTALFFHARRVSPGWRLTRVGVVGNHVFYQ